MKGKKDYFKQKIVVSEDTLLGWKKNPWKMVRTFFEEKNKRLPKKKSLVSEDIYGEKKKDYQLNIVVSEDTLLGWKKSLGNGEWGHTLKRKTKDYQRKKVWWVKTSIKKKKDYYKQKIVVGEDILLGWKKSLENGEWGHLYKIEL